MPAPSRLPGLRPGIRRRGHAGAEAADGFSPAGRVPAWMAAPGRRDRPACPQPIRRVAAIIAESTAKRPSAPDSRAMLSDCSTT